MYKRQFRGLKYAENAIAADGPGFTPDPTGEADDAPLDPIVGWTADTPPHTIPHPTWRLDARAFSASIVVPPDTKSWRRHCLQPTLPGTVVIEYHLIGVDPTTLS